MGINSIYSDILTEHNLQPSNKYHLKEATTVLQGVNPSCGDEIELELKIEDGVLQEAAFTGIGCAISQASTDIMVDLIIGKTIEEAMMLCETFIGMIKGEITGPEQLKELDEAIAFQDISHMPARVKCAVLAWRTLESALKKD